MNLKLIPFIISLLLLCENNIFGKKYEDLDKYYGKKDVTLSDYKLKGKIKSFSKTRYDLVGYNRKDSSIIETANYYFNPSGFLTFHSDSLFNREREYYTYDANNRLINIQTILFNADYSIRSIYKNKIYYKGSLCIKRENYLDDSISSYNTYTYDTINNCIIIKYIDSYDKRTETNTILYNKNNNIIKINSSSGYNSSYKLKYDNRKNIISVKNDNHSIKYEYNNKNNITRKSEYYSGKLYSETTYLYDSIENNIKTSFIERYKEIHIYNKSISIFDDNNRLIEYKLYHDNKISKYKKKYNKNNLLVTELFEKFDDNSSSGLRNGENKYIYDSNNNLIEKREYDYYQINLLGHYYYIKTKLELNRVSKYFYNDKNQNILIKYYKTYKNDYELNNIDSISYYESNLKKTQVSCEYYPYSNTSELYKIDSFIYDNNNRLIYHYALNHSDTTRLYYKYNNNDSIIYICMWFRRDSDSIPFITYTYYIYNSENKLTEEILEENYKTHLIYSYDIKGRLKAITDNSNIIKSIFYYSKDGKEIEERYEYYDYNWKEAPYITTFSYDKYGNIIEERSKHGFYKYIYEYYE